MSMSTASASSSIEVPFSWASTSMDRTASAISWRPPYPMATLTTIPVMCAVAASASFRAVCIPDGSRSGVPTWWTRQRPSAARPRTTSSMMPRSGTSSSFGRSKLSVDSSQRVTTSTSVSLHQPRNSSILSAPARWPWTVLEPAAFAQRRLPSMMTPMCLGT